jgi:DNA-binding CsgD family transcriptional regulator/MFS family permease
MKVCLCCRQNLAYILPAALYALWQTSVGWLNTAWTQLRLGDDFTTLNFVLFFAAHALSIVFFARRLDNPASAGRLKGLVFGSTLTAAVLTAAMAFLNGLWLIAAGVLTGFFAGFVAAYLSFYLLLHVAPTSRGMVVGSASAAGLAIHYVLFTLIFRETTGAVLYGTTFFAAAVFLALGFVTIALPVCKENLWQEQASFYTGYRKGEGLHPRLLPLLVLFLIIFNLSYGIQDFAATAYWMNGSTFLGHTRIFLILGFVLGGFLWDQKRRGILMTLAFGLLALGFIAMSDQYKGLPSFIGFAGVQTASVFFSLSIRLIFLEIARFYKRPVLMAALGLALPMVLKQAGLFSAGVLYMTSGGTVLFIVSLISIALAFPFITPLFDRIREIKILEIRSGAPGHAAGTDAAENPALENMSRQKMLKADKASAPDSGFDKTVLELMQRKHKFTKRELQILELSLNGLTNTEMAQCLSVSEATVKYHIRNILAKTETKNLKQLLLTTAKEHMG